MLLYFVSEDGKLSLLLLEGGKILLGLVFLLVLENREILLGLALAIERNFFRLGKHRCLFGFGRSKHRLFSCRRLRLCCRGAYLSRVLIFNLICHH